MAENNDEKIIMSRYAFERMQAKDERNDMWRNKIIVFLIIVLVITNGLWLYFWNQYDYISEDSVEIEASQDGSGINLVSGGDMNYGTDGNSTQETEQFESTP